jgi:hypothetical protein
LACFCAFTLDQAGQPEFGRLQCGTRLSDFLVDQFDAIAIPDLVLARALAPATRVFNVSNIKLSFFEHRSKYE